MKISSVYIMICQSFDPRFYKPWGSHKWDPKQLELSYHISEKVTAAPLWGKMGFLFWNHWVITKVIFLAVFLTLFLTVLRTVSLKAFLKNKKFYPLTLIYKCFYQENCGKKLWQDCIVMLKIWQHSVLWIEVTRAIGCNHMHG